MELILEVRDLVKIYPPKSRSRSSVPALKGVSLKVFAGESLGVVGESEAGKSTLARLVCRFEDPSGGSIFLLGRDVTGAKGRALNDFYRAVQMIFQSPRGSFDPRRKIGDEVGESLRIAGFSREERRQRVENLLAQCGLPSEIAYRFPHEVSAGQCQRASIARALAASPKILVCDEITSALDASSQLEIVDLLRSLREKHALSCLFISHSIPLVQSFCDRVVVLHNGEIVEEDETNAIIFSPKSEHTKRLIDACE